MKLTTAFAITMLACSTAAAQAPAAKPDPFSRFLYPPELVMANAVDIDLTDAQRATLRAEILKAQATFSELQWRVSDEGIKLGKLLAPASVDEGAVTAQVEKILQVEYTMKKMQLQLLVRVKNALTLAQQAKLDALRPKGD
jgi:Spy/CpxP family protein refolding chaperone